jgi:hypothetical protein
MKKGYYLAKGERGKSPPDAELNNPVYLEPQTAKVVRDYAS